MIEIDAKYAYTNLYACAHEGNGAKCRYPDGSLVCWPCWSTEHAHRQSVRRTHLAKCHLELCQRSMVRDGLCLDHFEARRRRQLRVLA